MPNLYLVFELESDSIFLDDGLEAGLFIFESEAVGMEVGLETSTNYTGPVQPGSIASFHGS